MTRKAATPKMERPHGEALPRSSAGRDLTPKGQQTRERIVAAAAELMFTQGVAGTSLDHVRAAVGVSNSQIYHYFDDKEALVRAVIEYQNDTIVGMHESMFASLDSIRGLRAWRDFIVNYQRGLQCTGGCPIASLGSELAEIDPEARAGVAAGFTRWDSVIRCGYEAMHKRGALRADADPEALATATLAALQGGLLLAQMSRSTKPLEISLDTILEYVATLSVKV